MKRFLIATLTALFVSSFCDDFNYEMFKKYPEYIFFSDYKDGDVAYSPKIMRRQENNDLGFCMLEPNIIRLNGEYICRIRFYSTKGKPTKIQFTFENSVKKVFPITGSSIYELDGKRYQYSTCKIPKKEYIKYFVKDCPTRIGVKIPECGEELFDAPMPNAWKKSLEEMKVFFKLD